MRHIRTLRTVKPYRAGDDNHCSQLTGRSRLLFLIQSPGMCRVWGKA